MKLIDFWGQLPGEWTFKRHISNDSGQSGTLKIEKITPELYQVCENGAYECKKGQAFFRDYRFKWEDHALKIFGANPKDGYVLLHILKDGKRFHVHQCNKDFYKFNLQEIRKEYWSSVITVTGPRKNFEIVTKYIKTQA